MKKTLITLLALAGISGTSSALEYGADVLRVGNAYDANVTATFEDSLCPVQSITFADCRAGSYLDYEKDEQGNAILGENGQATFTNTLGYRETHVFDGMDTMTPDTNIGNGGKWVVDMAITLRPGVMYTELTSLSFTAFAFNSSGYGQNADTYVREISFTLYDGNTLLGTANIPFTKVNSDQDWVSTYTMYFDTPVAISSMLRKDLRLEVVKSSSTGTYVGVKNVAVGIVPEPTTATLSLLALAGLAARRRRK